MDLWVGRALFIIFAIVMLAGGCVAQFLGTREQIRMIRKAWKNRKSLRDQ